MMRNIIEGTAPSSPINPNLKRKFSITTIVSFILWIPTCFSNQPILLNELINRDQLFLILAHLTVQWLEALGDPSIGSSAL